MLRACSFGGIAFLLAAQPARCQSPPAGAAPHARAHHVLFYDPLRERVMLTGGASNDSRRNVTVFDDFWSFDGTRWTALPSSSGPSSGARVDSDSQKRIYSFGGFKDAAIGDLLMLEGDRWRNLGSHPSLTAVEGGFVFDQARGRFVAFGGGSASGRMNGEVWEFDGDRWSRSAASPPAPRGSHAMVYDPVRKKVVLFGGMGVRAGEQDAPVLADTWEFDGTAWAEVRVAGPSARLGAGAAFDSKRGVMLLFGGANHDRVFNDLWSWNGATWRKLAENGPEPRVMGYLAYDRRRDRIVLFGGRRGVPDNSDLGDTWEWDGSSWTQIKP